MSAVPVIYWVIENWEISLQAQMRTPAVVGLFFVLTLFGCAILLAGKFALQRRELRLRMSGRANTGLSQRSASEEVTADS
jgi:hypothetical protein